MGTTDAFTNVTIRSFKPRAHEYARRDPDHPGLALRIHPTGTKTWVFFYDVRGRRRRLTLGTYPTLSLKQARIRYHRARLAVADGGDPAFEQREQARALAQTPTVAQLAELYMDRYAKVYKRTWREDRRILDKDILPVWRHRLITELRRRDVAELLDAIVARGAPFSANAAQVVLSKMFNWAVERELLPASPAAGLSKRGRYIPRERVLSEAELGLFFEAMRAARIDRFRQSLYAFQLLTATRPGEAREARWDELDCAVGLWRLPGVQTKNQTGHRLPLSTQALQLLDDLPRPDPVWVFPSPVQPGPLGRYHHAATIRRLLDTGVLRCASFTPHDLRRTAATHLAGLGTSRTVIAKILNHTEPGVTAIYDRYTYDAEMRAALEVWGERLLVVTGAANQKTNRTTAHSP